MVECLASPFTDTFADFRQSVRRSCFLCSPYITPGPVRALVRSLQERGVGDGVQVRVLTDLSLPNLIQGATDLGALLTLHEHLPDVRITHLPRLHAKVFIADTALALVGSANFTDGGTARNYEYGLRVREPALVAQIQQDLTRYAALGGPASAARLRELQQQILPLREAARDAQRALRQALSGARVAQQQAAEDTLIRIRVEGRSVNAVFADTLLYLLSPGPATTASLNEQIAQIHPDLCDDSVDRVIDGVRYGKKWKHQVRGAQVSLARQGRLAYDRDTRLWHRKDPAP